MPDISLTSYPAQLAEIQRQQQLAQMLQQQSAEPLPIESYKGIQAPISKYAGLAKLLEAYGANVKSQDATRGLADLNSTAQGQARDFANGLFGGSATAPPHPGAALAGALAGGAPQPAVPQPAPQAVPPAPQQPVSPPTAPGDTLGPLRDAYQRALAGVNNPNPFIANTAKAALPALQAQMDHAQAQQDQLERQRSDQAFQAQQKDAERQADVTRAQQIATQVLGAGHYTPQQAQLVQAAAASGSAGLNSILGKLGDRAFAETNSILPPAAVKALGLPDGSVVSQNDTTKAIKLEYNPLPDQRGAAEVAISRANEQLHAQSVGIEAKAENAREAQAANAILPPETIQMMAERAWAGDKSVFSGLGYGQAGAVNRAALQNAVAASGRANGKTGADLAAMNANFVGTQAEQRAIGARAGAADFANTEVPRVAALSKEAYAALPRGQYMPFNRMRNLAERELSSPEQAAAVSADIAVTRAYARAMSPNGIPKESDEKKAEQMLNQAQSQEVHDRVIDQILKETQAILAGSKEARAAPGSAPAAPQGIVIYYDAQGRRVP